MSFATLYPVQVGVATVPTDKYFLTKFTNLQIGAEYSDSKILSKDLPPTWPKSWFEMPRDADRVYFCEMPSLYKSQMQSERLSSVKVRVFTNSNITVGDVRMGRLKKKKGDPHLDRM